MKHMTAKDWHMLIRPGYSRRPRRATKKGTSFPTKGRRLRNADMLARTGAVSEPKPKSASGFWENAKALAALLAFFGMLFAIWIATP